MNAPLSLPVKMNTAAALQMVEDLRKIDGDFDLDASQSTSTSGGRGRRGREGGRRRRA